MIQARFHRTYSHTNSEVGRSYVSNLQRVLRNVSELRQDHQEMLQKNQRPEKKRRMADTPGNKPRTFRTIRSLPLGISLAKRQLQTVIPTMLGFQ